MTITIFYAAVNDDNDDDYDPVDDIDDDDYDNEDCDEKIQPCHFLEIN